MPHKEERFLAPLVPILNAYASIASATWCSPVDRAEGVVINLEGKGDGEIQSEMSATAAAAAAAASAVYENLEPVNEKREMASAKAAADLSRARLVAGINEASEEASAPPFAQRRSGLLEGFLGERVMKSRSVSLRHAALWVLLALSVTAGVYLMRFHQVRCGDFVFHSIREGNGGFF